MATTVTIPNAWTINGFSGGVTAVAGRGPTYAVMVDGAWTVGDKFVFQIVLPAQTYDFGTGRVTGFVPVSAITLNERVHFVATTFWLGSDNNDATAWEQQASGAFNIEVSNQVAQNENLLSLSPFQGRMAVFSRNTITIWALDANPTNISLIQTISNMGTVGPFATQSLGDFDVLFPSDSGIRSLRVLTINLNGFIDNIGSSIDTITRAAVLQQTTTQLKGICGAVDPQSKNYMIYFPSTNTIYVLSYHPSLKITAWSKFTPQITVSGPPYVYAYFNISTFRIFNSIVYFRANCIDSTTLPFGLTGFIGAYGAYKPEVSNLTYDNVSPTVTFPWLDLRKAGTLKTACELDYVVQGQWSLYGSMDFNGWNKSGGLSGGIVQTIASQVNKGQSGVAGSFQTGSVDWTDEGFHVLIKAVADDPAALGVNAILSEVVFHYSPGDEK